MCPPLSFDERVTVHEWDGDGYTPDASDAPDESGECPEGAAWCPFDGCVCSPGGEL